jgi:hypothetical protein
MFVLCVFRLPRVFRCGVRCRKERFSHFRNVQQLAEQRKSIAAINTTIATARGHLKEAQSRCDPPIRTPVAARLQSADVLGPTC